MPFYKHGARKSFLVKIPQTNVIIFTKCADLELKNKINYIIIAQVLPLSILQVFFYVCRILSFKSTNAVCTGKIGKDKIRYIFIKVSPCFFTYNDIRSLT